MRFTVGSRQRSTKSAAGQDHRAPVRDVVGDDADDRQGEDPVGVSRSTGIAEPLAEAVGEALRHVDAPPLADRAARRARGRRRGTTTLG